MTSRADGPLRIVTVCSHNRTRSVMMAALLEVMLTERLGEHAVQIRSSGFGPTGLPPIDDAVDAMRSRGIDVSAHRSSTTTASLVDEADVILTAERAHVVKIAALSPAAFRRAMTLPEFLSSAADALDERDAAPGDVGGDAVRCWIEQITADRRAGDYLRDQIVEVADPTGSMPKAFEAAVAAIEQQCREAAAFIASRAR